MNWGNSTLAIDRVGYQQVADLVQQLSSRNLSTTTIQQHLVATRKVLHYAHGLGLIKSLPKFPSVKVTWMFESPHPNKHSITEICFFYWHVGFFVL